MTFHSHDILYRLLSAESVPVFGTIVDGQRRLEYQLLFDPAKRILQGQGSCKIGQEL